MLSILTVLLASNLLVMSDCENFCNPDKISPQTAVMLDSTQLELPIDLKQFEGKKVLIAVHGFNNSYERAMSTYHIISDHVAALQDDEGNRLYDIVVGYLWPGYDHSLEYYAAKTHAKQLRERMRVHLQRISQVASQLDILAHSMGNRLIFEALNFTPRQPQKNLVENFYALAPAIDDEMIEYKNKYFRSTQNCHDLYVFYSKQDDVLKFLYHLAECDEALGEEGVGNLKKLPKNVQMIDCTAFVDGHSHYFEAPALYEFIQHEVIFRKSPLGLAKTIQVKAGGEAEAIQTDRSKEPKGVLERLKMLLLRLKRNKHV